jgi:hypothetical protein
MSKVKLSAVMMLLVMVFLTAMSTDLLAAQRNPVLEFCTGTW